MGDNLFMLQHKNEGGMECISLRKILGHHVSKNNISEWDSSEDQELPANFWPHIDREEW